MWETLSDLMAGAALSVDSIRSALIWVCVLLAPVYLIALAAWAINRISGEASDVGEATSCHRPSSLHDRLEQMANVAVSRRPQTRKRRHHHRHHPHNSPRLPSLPGTAIE